MIKKLLILASLLFAVFISIDAQKMTVESFEYLPKDLTARTSPRNDRNGTPCAVIRVGIALQGVVFDGNTIGAPVYNTGEYLVYMPEGSKQLTIRHDSYLPLTVVFADYGIDKVESSSTYRLTVPIGAAPPLQRKGNFLTMNVTPASSQVSIDDGASTATESDGSFKVYLTNGTHSYRVEAGNAYSPVSGTVEMKGERITLPITLKSLKASLTVKTITSGSKIYVNEDYKGIDQWQGSLSPGTYLVEAKKDGYRPYSTTVSLAKQQSESLIIPALQASYGTLMVDYKPIDADVYLDNTLLGKAPNVFDKILAGKHNIKISKAGYADYTGSVTIQENQQASVSGSLSKSSGAASVSHTQANISTTNTINGHEWVDLGLSVKWATCNVGATLPSDYGDYLAWGEISTKSSYTENNSKTYNKHMGDIAGNSQYDAARANWGSTWRMPTEKEFQELQDQCTWTWRSQGGHKGYRITSKTNGNSIFLPAAGSRYEKSLYLVGSNGYYWSAGPSNTTDGRHLLFNSGNVFPQSYNSRAHGFSVRPVSE